MAIPYEKLVEEDLQLGHGSVDVTMPAGGTATGTKIGLHTFTGMFNVKDFGATGDGRANDSPGIQAAIDACPDGGVVYLPPGTYRILTGLRIGPPIGSVGADAETPRVSLRGAGPQVSQLVGAAGVTVLSLVTGVTGLTDCQYEQFAIMGGARGIHIAQYAANHFGMVHCAFRDLMLWNLTGEGLYSDTFEILETTFEHIDAELCDYGGRLASYVAVCSFNQCQWRECTTCGLSIGGTVNNCVLYNNLFESNYRTGLIVDGPQYAGATLVGGWFENNGREPTGGPYPNVIVRATNIGALAIGSLTFLNVMLESFGTNTNRLAVTAEANILGPLTFQNCFFGSSPATVDVTANATRVVFIGRVAAITGASTCIMILNPFTGELSTYGNHIVSGPANPSYGFRFAAAGGIVSVGNGAFHFRDEASVDFGVCKLYFGPLTALGAVMRRNGSGFDFMDATEGAFSQIRASDAKLTGKVLATGGLGVGNIVGAAAITGALAAKMEVFNSLGASLGFIPVYTAIT